MSTDWSRFVAALECNGRSFRQLAFASDRIAVIAAAGFEDPFSVAVIETEWQARLEEVMFDRTGARVEHKGVEVSSSRPELAPPVGKIRRTETPGSKGVPPLCCPRNALDAYDPAQLLQAPEEVQDTVIATELLAAMIGHSGSYFTQQKETGAFSPTAYVPLSMRGLVASVLPIADAFFALRLVERAEFTGRSLVAMALGEVVSEISTSYVHQVARIQHWSQGRSMPLMGVTCELQRIGQHVLRMRQVIPVEAKNGSSECAVTLAGGLLLNHLHEQLGKFSGSKDDQQLLGLLLRRVSIPYLSILKQWMQEGNLNDPFGEFFISENKRNLSRGVPTGVSDTSGTLYSMMGINTQMPGSQPFAQGLNFLASAPGGREEDAISFDRRFTLNRSLIPQFLLTQGRLSKMILYTGRYCCLLREYNGTLPSFPDQEAPLVWTSADDLQRVVHESYDLASAAVMQVLYQPQVDLLGHLNSLKSYFFHFRGDWLVDFLDSADQLLHKSPVQVKGTSVRILLQSAIAKSCASDPYHTMIGCNFADSTIDQLVQASLSAGPSRPSGSLGLKIETRRCIELLQLEANLRWPATLVLDPGALSHMNVVFRLLMWCKVCERNLHKWWHRGVKSVKAHALKHQMLSFLRQFQFYAAHFIIEPKWGAFMQRLSSATSVLMISNAMQDFFEGVESGLVLNSTHRFRHFSNVLNVMTRFCDVGRHALGKVNMAQLHATIQGVEESFQEALAELASPTGPDYQQLVPLLTWLDFSRYYERNGIYRVQRGVASTAGTE